MSAHVLLAGGDYGLLRLRIIYYDSAWPRTVGTKRAGEQLPPQVFDKPVIPIPNKGGRLWPKYYYSPYCVLKWVSRRHILGIKMPQ